MPNEDQKEIGLEIGHVLFIDIVGYSKLLITEQTERLQKLKENRGLRGFHGLPTQLLDLESASSA